MSDPARRPDWLKMPFPDGSNYRDLKSLVSGQRLHTVCEAARCPNIGECWNQRTATFMLLGDVCTRSCGFCNIATGRPGTVDEDEPTRVADAVAYLGLRYCVLTSVNRDELPDGGARIFAETITQIHERLPSCRVEVLIPDFKGDEAALRTVLDASPATLNHNVETVPRLYRQVHPQADYARDLTLFRRSRAYRNDIPVKTGYMLGHGETFDECVALMGELVAAGVSTLTIGQYLRPSPKHLPVVRFWEPQEFDRLREAGLALGFAHVEAGPLVRSSYHAAEQEAAATGQEFVPLTAQVPVREVQVGQRRGLVLLPVVPGDAS